MQRTTCQMEECCQVAQVHFSAVEERKITHERWLCAQHADAFLMAYYSQRDGDYVASIPHPAQVECQIESLVYDERHGSYVFLAPVGCDWRFPFSIGACEESAIRHALKGPNALPRPLTHAVFADVIRSLRGDLQYVVVDAYLPASNTYIATLRLGQYNAFVEVDSRPSDAMALAVVLERPIFFMRDVLQVASDSALPAR